MKNSHIKGLSHIGIFTNDIDASIDFYKRLGFSLDKEADIGLRLAFLSAGCCRIELIARPHHREAGVVDHIAMEVDDIDAAVACAVANGIKINAEDIKSVDIFGGIKNVFFTGPDGERLEFFEHSSQA